MQNDIAQATLTAIGNGRDAFDVDHSAFIFPKLQLSLFLGNQCIARAGNECHCPRFVEIGNHSCFKRLVATAGRRRIADRRLACGRKKRGTQ